MALWDMIAFVVLVGVIGRLITRGMKVREARYAAAGAGADKATQSRIDQLEERVRVLERIVTDKAERLKDEIDAL